MVIVNRSEKLTTLRSEEHTSELQSRQYLVCRLLLEKKEHTSELQSRFEISYAVFCLKQKHACVYDFLHLSDRRELPTPLYVVYDLEQLIGHAGLAR